MKNFKALLHWGGYLYQNQITSRGNLFYKNGEWLPSIYEQLDKDLAIVIQKISIQIKHAPIKSIYYSSAQLAQKLYVFLHDINFLLCECFFQKKEGEDFVVTNKGKVYSKIEGKTIMWKDFVLSFLETSFSKELSGFRYSYLKQNITKKSHCFFAPVLYKISFISLEELAVNENMQNFEILKLLIDHKLCKTSLFPYGLTSKGKKYIKIFNNKALFHSQIIKFLLDPQIQAGETFTLPKILPLFVEEQSCTQI